MSTGRLGSWLLDSGPVVVLAVIAGAGSFVHVRDTAAEHGQDGLMAWAIAVCVELLCVAAARERQRDKRRSVPSRGWVSWPILVLTGGVLLSLSANLAQAEPTAWGRVMAVTPPVAFLLAISLLERRVAAGSGGVPEARRRVPEAGRTERGVKPQHLMTAVELWRDSPDVTGEVVAAAIDRSDRWGRVVLEEARRHLANGRGHAGIHRS